jgi:hypothetical protein
MLLMQSCPAVQSDWLVHAGFASADDRQTESTQTGMRASISSQSRDVPQL